MKSSSIDFDITDTSNITKALIKIDSLQCILMANDNCALDLDQIKFVSIKRCKQQSVQQKGEKGN
jgi:hypothetical protein